LTAFYLAARYSRHPEMQAVRDVLQSLGHQVTSRWIDCHTAITGDHSKSFTPEILNERPDECAVVALHDLEDLVAADAIIFFSEGGAPGKGGRFVEWGYAYALGKRMILVGDRENVFHTLPWVEHYPNWPRLVMALGQEWADTVIGQ
jgi:nucleoside 2-deoxyribosyltransferase